MNVFQSPKWVYCAIIILIAGYQALGMTGFCHAEFRYLSNRELLDRFLFGPHGELFAPAKKVEMARELGLEYPECCRLKDVPWWLDTTDVIGNFLIFGRYFYEVDFYAVNQSTDASTHPYRHI